MAESKYQLTRPTQQRNFKDGINDKFNNTIFDDFNYGRPDKSSPLKQAGERAKAYRNGKTKPSRRLNPGGQDYATRDREHMGRNPDGSKRLIPKNSSPKVRPS